jgi:calpain-15
MNGQQNQYGLYVIQLHIRGKPWLVQIDDYILVEYTQKGWFQFKYADIDKHKKTIWPLLLEKAWAKTMGGYTNAERGHPENALSAILGVPVFRHLTDDTEEAADIFT